MPCKSQNDRKTAGRTLLTPARSFRDDLQRWPLLTFLPLVHTEEVANSTQYRARRNTLG